VVILGAVVTAIMLTDTHKKQAVAGAAARNYAEAIETEVATGYVDCAGTGAYVAAAPSVPDMFAAILSVEYWTGTGWQSTCTADKGMQRLTVRVSDHSTGAGKVNETLTVVLRRP
jgi:hypothetical protein